MDRSEKLEKKKQKMKSELMARQNAKSSVDKTKQNFSASQFLEKAEELMDSFELDLALKFCVKALNAEPNNVKALELQGSIHLQLGRPDEAYESYSKAVQLEPEVGHTKYMCMGQLSCADEAVAHYKKGIEIMKKELSQQEIQISTSSNKESIRPLDLSNAYLSVAEIYLTDLCFEENAEQLCKENLDTALTIDPNNAEIYHLYASYLISKDDKKSALEYINKGVNMWLPQLKEVQKGESNNPDASFCPIGYSGRINCSKLLIELENYETAGEILEYLLDEDDQVVEVWYILGWLNYLRGSDYFGNVKGYMEKGLELAEKIKFEDKEMVAHMKELLEDVSKVVVEEESMETEENGDEGDDDFSSDENDEETETAA